MDEVEFNEFVERALKHRGFVIVDEIDASPNVLVVETFLYQNYGQYPTIIIMARSRAGVHYIDGSSIRAYITAVDGYFSLLDKLHQFCFRISHIFKFIKATTSLEILTIAKAILAFSALYLT